MAADSTQRAEKETARTVIPLNPRLKSSTPPSPQPRVSNARSWEEAGPGLAGSAGPCPGCLHSQAGRCRPPR